MNSGDECLRPETRKDFVIDGAARGCGPVDPPSLSNVAAEFHAKPNQKVGYGHANNADPVMAGRIAEDMRKPPNRNVIYRYSKAVRGCDEAMKELFSDLACIDELGGVVPVPIIWGSQERAVAHVLQSNVRKDSTLVVNRVELPLLSIVQTGIAMNTQRYIYHGAVNYFRDLRADGKPGLTTREARNERDTIFGVSRGVPVDISYQLAAWTLYAEDMNQILEQVLLKFSHLAYISVQGVHGWETTVRLDSIANNMETEPGDQQVRVVKFVFNMTAESFIPQPVVRRKAVLGQQIDLVDAVEDADITEVIARLENVIGGA